MLDKSFIKSLAESLKKKHGCSKYYIKHYSLPCVGIKLPCMKFGNKNCYYYYINIKHNIIITKTPNRLFMHGYVNDEILHNCSLVIKNKFNIVGYKFNIAHIGQDDKYTEYYSIELLDNSYIISYTDGHKEWWVNGKRHREDGPALITADGSREWWMNGMLHRKDGPVREYQSGYKEWRNHVGQLHREDGPAIEYADGGKEWYVNGKLHREDGPAIVYEDEKKWWYLNNHLITEDKYDEEVIKYRKSF